MSLLKVATWNVNSLRIRIPQVLAWLADEKPDVLALQETKLLDADFPLLAFKEAGYDAVFSGQRTYNGVALLSKVEAKEVVTELPDFIDPQKRLLSAVINGIQILNLYVPNGENIFSTKFQYKLLWLEKLDFYLKQELKKRSKIIILGDFNIAPDEIDVYDPKRLAGKILFSHEERKAFQAILGTGFLDCFRKLNPTEKNFTWWDYRMNAFKRNLGLRIDHILASTELAPHCKRCYVDKNPRAADRPSDHALMVAEFDLSSEVPSYCLKNPSCSIVTNGNACI